MSSTPHEPHTAQHTGHHQHSGHDDHAGHNKHAGHDPEMFRRRFWISLILTVPLVVTSHMVMDWFGYTLDFPGIEWVGPVLGSIVFLWAGWPFLQGGVREIRDRQPGMMLLISMAITVAYAASMATSLGWFDLDFWWELAALVTIMLLGHWQEMKAIGQAQNALAALAELIPDEAEVVRGEGVTETVPIDTLAVGDVVLVRAGGRVPVDGEILDGEAELDESMITGESRPVEKREGDRVVAGTVSTDSSLRISVVAVGDDTALAGIQRMVADAQESSSRAQVLADRFAALLFYVAAGAALATFVAWAALGDVDSAVVKTVTVLVIACPHALGLAIPLVIAISTAVSARAGILVKDRLALERMRTIDAVLFDKTGTLTKGAHVVTGVAAADTVDEDRMVAIAGAVESDSEHPLARAITAEAARRGDVPAATDFRARTGRGVDAVVDGEQYSVGGPALLRELGAPVPGEVQRRTDEWVARGAAALYLFHCFFLVMNGGLRETRRHLKAMTEGDLTTEPSPWGRDGAAALMLDLRDMQHALRQYAELLPSGLPMNFPIISERPQLPPAALECFHHRFFDVFTGFVEVSLGQPEFELSRRYVHQCIQHKQPRQSP